MISRIWDSGGRREIQRIPYEPRGNGDWPEGRDQPVPAEQPRRLVDLPPEADLPEAENGPGLEVGRHVRQILDAAERVAADVRADAEAQARKYLDATKRQADEKLEQVNREAEQKLEETRRQADEKLDQTRREADERLEEARRRADQLVEERARITGALGDQAGKLREQYDRFLESLDSALTTAARSGADGGLIDRLRHGRPQAQDAPPREPPRPPQQEPYRPPEPPPRQPPQRSSGEGTLPGGYQPRSKRADD